MCVSVSVSVYLCEDLYTYIHITKIQAGKNADKKSFTAAVAAVQLLSEGTITATTMPN